MKGWWQPLHLRLSLLAAALLLLVGAALWALSARNGERAALEATQRMHLGLADYIVAHQPRPLIRSDGRADADLMREMAGMVMKINPAVEVYLLDQRGHVLMHAIEGLGALSTRVDTQRVHSLVAPLRPEVFPVLGDDPREPGRSTIVSVAPIGDASAMRGYLYVVLQGRVQQQLNATFGNSTAMRHAALGIALVVAGAALVLAWVLTRLTRPLRELTAETERFRDEDGNTTHALAAPPIGSEIDRLRHATLAMRERIALQFRRIEDAERMRRELIGNISHDLHTPLASVQGYVETVLLRGNALTTDEREQHLRTALSQARKLDRRIAELFELSKLDAGRVQPQAEVFCLAELLQDVVQDYRLEAEHRRITVALEAGSHAQARVRADIALIGRVLQNLVDNALRHTSPGGRVRLAIESAEPRHLTLTVSDDGAGIAPENLPHIFERYWQGGQGREAQPADTPSRSAGLGLAIAKRIVELHGSVIRVHSVPEQGTTFAFALPQAA
jgi:two-component system, OmpR family, sensor kinase